MNRLNREEYIKKIDQRSKEPMVSNNIIETYRNDIEFLKDLRAKMRSGSFTPYDAQLYKSLSKKLTIQN